MTQDSHGTPLLTKTDDLARVCAEVKENPYITIDTEFVRERTYYPILCLIQIANPSINGRPGQAFAIDPLAPKINLSPLLELLLDPKILKVFHAARQDLEIFFRLCSELPKPIVDTQVLAMVCGFGDAASYETLAGKLAGARMDKLSRFTDWARRPLTDRQIDYALSDVTHLRTIYENLSERVVREDRREWIAEEMAILTSPKTYAALPGEAWRRLKLRSDKPSVFAIARAVAGWREREAQSRDLPRGRIISDETIIEIAAHPPKNVAELSRCRGLPKGFAEGRMGEAILSTVQDALALPQSEWPVIAPRPDIPSGLGPIVELLRVLLKHRCDQNNVAQKLVASMGDLERIAADSDIDVPALQGWRRALFGAEALDLKKGKIALTADGRKVKVIKLSEAQDE